MVVAALLYNSSGSEEKKISVVFVQMWVAVFLSLRATSTMENTDLPPWIYGVLHKRHALLSVLLSFSYLYCQDW